MLETTIFKLDGYETPKKLIQDFGKLVQKEGSQAVLKQNRFKPDCEKWVAGMTCIGMTKLTKRSWFVKPGDPKEQTPDFRAAAFDKIENEKYLIWDEVECEIVRCPMGLIPVDHKEPECIFFEHIEKTKLWKVYPENFVLVIYSQFTWKQFSLEKLSKFFCDRAPKLREIWVLMNISLYGDRHLLAKLYPNRLDVEIDNSDLLYER